MSLYFVFASMVRTKALAFFQLLCVVFCYLLHLQMLHSKWLFSYQCRFVKVYHLFDISNFLNLCMQCIVSKSVPSICFWKGYWSFWRKCCQMKRCLSIHVHLQHALYILWMWILFKMSRLSNIFCSVVFWIIHTFHFLFYPLCKKSSELGCQVTCPEEERFAIRTT